MNQRDAYLNEHGEVRDTGDRAVGAALTATPQIPATQESVFLRLQADKEGAAEAAAQVSLHYLKHKRQLSSFCL